MSVKHKLEAALVAAGTAALGAGSWRDAIARGAALGDLARRLGVRARVARENLSIAFPEKTAEERETILRDHYLELGRVVAEYARLPELVRTGEPLRELRGLENLAAARAGGKGAILMSGHFSNFELMAALVARDQPMDLMNRRMANPDVERWIDARRRAAGLGLISAETGAREVYEALRANRFVTMLADQNAGRHGVFVPWFGRPASTAVGPARIAIARGAPIVMGFCVREPDGRLVIELEPPWETGDLRDPDAALALTARHTARLETWVRRHPSHWFWLHRRWKTRPPDERAGE